MRKVAIWLLAAGVLGAAIGLFITRPGMVDPATFASLEGDASRGEAVYWAGGCASCHGVEGDEEKLTLAGGERFDTAFGTFVAPNISPGPEGLGDWTLTDFANAMLKGTTPDGSHYYPAFPYSSYARMSDGDVADLWAFMQTLPVSDAKSAPHELGFPFNIRLSVGGWKLLYFNNDFVGPSEPSERGRYLVESAGHCAECHTPRTALGGLDTSRWMAGAPNPSGKGKIPGLTPAQLRWSAGDIAYYLETGFTPDFDSAGGEMVAVIRNMAKLPAEDRAAIADYIKALPAAE